MGIFSSTIILEIILIYGIITWEEKCFALFYATGMFAVSKFSENIVTRILSCKARICGFAAMNAECVSDCDIIKCCIIKYQINEIIVFYIK